MDVLVGLGNVAAVIALSTIGPGATAQHARGLAGGSTVPQPPFPCSRPGQRLFPEGQLISTNFEAIAAADLDGDGDSDFVTLGTNLSIFLGDGRGNFTSHDHDTSPGRALAFLDIQGDGDLDLAIACQGLPQVTLLENLGGGTFAPAGTIALSSSAHRISTLDVENDGRTDLVVGHNSVNRVGVFRNLGGGAFGHFQTIQTAAPVRDLGALDQDADGLQDLVIAAANDSVMVHRNFGNRFAFPFGVNLGDPEDMLVFDADGDGDEDIVVSTGGSPCSSGLYTVRNDGPGQLTALRSASTCSFPRDLTTVDIDSDGSLDVAWTEMNYTTPQHLGAVRVLRNDGTGIFSSSTTHVVVASGSLATGDWNADGRDDLVAMSGHFVSSVGEGLISVFLNRGTGFVHEPSYPAGGDYLESMDHADLDGDGDQDLAALRDNYSFQSFAILLNDGAAALAPPLVHDVSNSSSVADLRCADLDGDGAIDLVFRSDDAFQVYLNSGVFVPGARTPVASSGRRLLARDLDGDGDLDLIGDRVGGLSLVENLGLAQFAPAADVPLSFDSRVLESADLDLDGDPDLVAGGDNRVQRIENLGGWGFSSAALATFSSLVTVDALACSDFDRDGDVDLWLGYSDWGPAPPHLLLYRNPGAGAFALALDRTLQFHPGFLRAEDLDRDGWLDLVGVSYSTSLLTLFHGTGTSAAPASSYFIAGRNPLDFSVSDLDADGDLDVACAEYATGRVTILRSRCE